MREESGSRVSISWVLAIITLMLIVVYGTMFSIEKVVLDSRNVSNAENVESIKSAFAGFDTSIVNRVRTSLHGSCCGEDSDVTRREEWSRFKELICARIECVGSSSSTYPPLDHATLSPRVAPREHSRPLIPSYQHNELHTEFLDLGAPVIELVVMSQSDPKKSCRIFKHFPVGSECIRVSFNRLSGPVFVDGWLADDIGNGDGGTAFAQVGTLKPMALDDFADLYSKEQKRKIYYDEGMSSDVCAFYNDYYHAALTGYTYQQWLDNLKTCIRKPPSEFVNGVGYFFIESESCWKYVARSSNVVYGDTSARCAIRTG